MCGQLIISMPLDTAIVDASSSLPADVHPLYICKKCYNSASSATQAAQAEGVLQKQAGEGPSAPVTPDQQQQQQQGSGPLRNDHSLQPVLDAWFDKHMVGSVNSISTERGISLLKLRTGPNTSNVLPETLTARLRLADSSRDKLIQQMGHVPEEQWKMARETVWEAQRQRAEVRVSVHARAHVQALQVRATEAVALAAAAATKAKADLIRSLKEQQLKKRLLAAVLGLTLEEVKQRFPNAAAVWVRLMQESTEMLGSLVPVARQAFDAARKHEQQVRAARQQATAARQKGERKQPATRSQTVEGPTGRGAAKRKRGGADGEPTALVPPEQG